RHPGPGHRAPHQARPPQHRQAAGPQWLPRLSCLAPQWRGRLGGTSVTGVSRQIVEPEQCLRSLADDAVRRAQGGELVLHCSLGVRATVNAFVLLGLVPEGGADKILAEYQEGLQQHSLGTAWGLSDGELPARSGAREVWEAHAAGAARLGEVPMPWRPPRRASRRPSPAWRPTCALSG